MLMDLELSSFRNYLFNHGVIIFIWALPENMEILTNSHFLINTENMRKI